VGKEKGSTFALAFGKQARAAARERLKSKKMLKV